MNKQTKIIGALLGAALAAASGGAVAESTYGYNSAGTGTVTATAKVNLSITVPKLVLLRIGSSGSTPDTLSWSTTPTWNSGANSPSGSPVNNAPTTWVGDTPVFSYVNPAAVNVYAWANGTTTTIQCSATGLGTAPFAPSLGDVSVTVGSTTNQLLHPTSTSLASCGTTTIASNVLHDGTWTYVLGGTATGWTAGSYTGSVTYTATSV